jgi:transcriptional regulator with XRE-family HTH domain
MTQQESNVIDGHIDEIVKAKWLAMGLSQSDLAEVLGQIQNDDKASNGTSAGRLMQIAEALNVPVTFFHRQPGTTGQEERDLSSIAPLDSLQSLLALRLLQAFHELTDQGAREVLVQLAEQIVKRQVNHR